MNIIILSPHFPHHHWLYCDRLHRRGVNVLGVADSSYESLKPELRGCLTEYYRVDNMENYDSLFRAVAYFIHQYGRIDGIYSHNEHWLETEARLRTDFNIPGAKYPDALEFKKKSLMKKHFKEAGVKTPRWKPVDTLEKAVAFAERVGYPLVIKPDTGTGSAHTWKIHNEEELEVFFELPREIPFIMEEFVPGDMETFDGIVDGRGRVVFSASHYFPKNIMEAVRHNSDIHFRSEPEVAEDLARAGEIVVRAFGARSQFFHLEFFRLAENRPGLGRKGQLVALEANMRPPGMHMVDMIDFTYDVDAYLMWADVVAGRRVRFSPSESCYCGYASRKAHFPYCHADREIHRLLGEHLLMEEVVDTAFAPMMGDTLYIFRSPRLEDIEKWTEMIQEKGPLAPERVRK